MATIDRSGTTLTPIYPPIEPVDPTHCPTCLSGTQPRDPDYEVAIDADKVAFG